MKKGWRSVRAGDVIVENPKSKLKVRDSISDGEYPFYTSGVSINSFDDFLCDGNNLFIATGGKACFQYYQGKAAYSTGCYSVTTRSGFAPKFLFYFLDSILEDIESNMFEGAALRHLQKTKFREILVPCPPLVEQQRIVGLLDEAFEGLATANANAEKNLQNARALFESHLQSVFTQRGPGWLDSTIGAEIKFIDYRGKTPVKTTSGVRLITAKNVKMGFLQETPMEFIAAASYKGWMTRGIPQKGDVLFTTEAPLANVAQLDTDEKVAFAQRIIIMQPNAARLDSTFLKYLLLSQPVQQRIRTKGTGATVQGIKASLLKLIAISFPKSLTTQEEIVSKLDDLREETQRLARLYERKHAALEALKKSLLHQAFSGGL